MSQLSFKDKVDNLIKEKPLYLGVLLVAVIALTCLVISAFKVLPGYEAIRWSKVTILDKGEDLIWLGMELVPISRTIREEFRIPNRVKGIFVLDDGRGIANAHDVKSGDVICSINRKKVYSYRSLVKVANNTKYYNGILLDIYRDGKSLYITIPFEYQYGPLFGPNKGHWQLGFPIPG
ncbi:MAG: hypothetical protein JSW40_00640 [Candidatus Omnitrophota bacterium]|nr:MAG: hypothetical protein JSW40_00640 [Candidatus Omnitrophota bacterium]